MKFICRHDAVVFLKGEGIMKRFKDNPILQPNKKNSWESQAVFNAAAIYGNGQVHILYRAMGDDNISRLGYATSNDGFSITERLDEPIFLPANHAERDGCEDPRLSIHRRPMLNGLHCF